VGVVAIPIVVAIIEKVFYRRGRVKEGRSEGKGERSFPVCSHPRKWKKTKRWTGMIISTSNQNVRTSILLSSLRHHFLQIHKRHGTRMLFFLEFRAQKATLGHMVVVHL
jgi:hypothetical protein